MNRYDSKINYRTRGFRLRVPDSSKYRILEYEDRTSETYSYIRDLVTNATVRVNSKRYYEQRHKMQ